MRAAAGAVAAAAAFSETGGVLPSGVASNRAATDTAVFLAYLDHVLIPELVEKKPRAIVVLDNLKPHLVSAVREKLEAKGLRLLEEHDRPHVVLTGSWQERFAGACAAVDRLLVE